jgi:hypothetical protein
MISIRAVTQHQGILFWAREDSKGPAIWYLINPVLEQLFNLKRDFSASTVKGTICASQCRDCRYDHGAL